MLYPGLLGEPAPARKRSGVQRLNFYLNRSRPAQRNDPCFGGFAQLLAGEVCLSTGTMNVAGRMGSTEAEIYMANAATVAASALAGEIADPRPLLA